MVVASTCSYIHLVKASSPGGGFSLATAGHLVSEEWLAVTITCVSESLGKASSCVAVYTSWT